MSWSQKHRRTARTVARQRRPRCDQNEAWPLPPARRVAGARSPDHGERPKPTAPASGGSERARARYLVVSWVARSVPTLAGTRGRVWTRAVGSGRSDGARGAQVGIEISGRAWSSDPARPSDDRRRGLEIDGRTELLRLLERYEPHRVIHSGPTGCGYSSTGETSSRR
jgi:hypothetical protein